MLLIILCFVGFAHGQYAPSAPYPPANEGPYPAAAQEVRTQPQSVQPIQHVQPIQLVQPTQIQPLQQIHRVIHPVHTVKPVQQHVYQTSSLQQPLQPIRTINPVPQQPTRTFHQIQPVRYAQPIRVESIHPVQPNQHVQPIQPVQSIQPIQPIQPVRSEGPYAPAQGVQLEGGELSPVEQDATSAGKYPSPGQQQLSGGDLSPEQLEIPPNTQVKLQDDRLQYTHGFSDDSGTSVREQGSLLSTNGGWEYVIAKKGSYSYISPEGKAIAVNYIADHNGFRVLPN